MNLGAQSRVRKWGSVTADKTYMVNARFIMMGNTEKPTLCSYLSKDQLLKTPLFSKTTLLYTLQFIS
jgi:hypothetical protein